MFCENIIFEIGKFLSSKELCKLTIVSKSCQDIIKDNFDYYCQNNFLEGLKSFENLSTIMKTKISMIIPKWNNKDKLAIFHMYAKISNLKKYPLKYISLYYQDF